MYLPIWFNTDDLHCLVIGGGNVALAKIKRLLGLGCTISVVAPEIHPEIIKLNSYKMTFKQRGFQGGDCHGFDLIIAATPDRNLNQAISKEAKSMNLPVNVVDDPALCSAIFSANLQEGKLGIAVSTSGAAPFLASAIRDKLAEFSNGWGDWVEAGSRLRSILLKSDIDKEMMYAMLKRFSQTDLTNGLYPTEEASLSDWRKWLDENV